MGKLKERIRQLLEKQEIAVAEAEKRCQQIAQALEVASADINHQRGRLAVLKELLEQDDADSAHG